MVRRKWGGLWKKSAATITKWNGNGNGNRKNSFSTNNKRNVVTRNRVRIYKEKKKKKKGDRTTNNSSIIMSTDFNSFVIISFLFVQKLLLAGDGKEIQQQHQYMFSADCLVIEWLWGQLRRVLAYYSSHSNSTNDSKQNKKNRTIITEKTWKQKTRRQVGRQWST